MQHTKRVVAALAAAMALVAIAGAPSAFAGYFQVNGGGTATYTAASSGQQFTQPGNIVGSCASGGHFVGAVSNLDKSLAASPSDMGCTSSAEGAVSWKWNGCNVTLRPGNDGSPLNGTLSIGGCSAVHVNSASCEKRIAPQSVNATFLNSGGAVQVKATGALVYTVVKSGGSCQNGILSYTGEWNVTPAGGSTILALSSKVGLFRENGQFVAQTPAYPVDVSGSQVAGEQHAITLVGGRIIKCAGVELTGQLAGPSQLLDLAPQYSECALHAGASKLPTTIDASACDYQVGNGALGILCGGEGGITINTYANATKQAEGIPLCVFRIGAQSGLSGVGLGNVGAGTEAGVKVQFGVGKVAYTRTTGTIGNCGEAKSTASYIGSSILYGVMA